MLIVQCKSKIEVRSSLCFIAELHCRGGVCYDVILNRTAEVKEHIPPTTAIHNTLISTFGVTENRYSSIFTDVLTLEDLFT